MVKISEWLNIVDWFTFDIIGSIGLTYILTSLLVLYGAYKYNIDGVRTFFLLLLWLLILTSIYFNWFVYVLIVLVVAGLFYLVFGKKLEGR